MRYRTRHHPNAVSYDHVVLDQFGNNLPVREDSIDSLIETLEGLKDDE